MAWSRIFRAWLALGLPQISRLHGQRYLSYAHHDTCVRRVPIVRLLFFSLLSCPFSSLLFCSFSSPLFCSFSSPLFCCAVPNKQAASLDGNVLLMKRPRCSRKLKPRNHSPAASLCAVPPCSASSRRTHPAHVLFGVCLSRGGGQKTANLALLLWRECR